MADQGNVIRLRRTRQILDRLGLLRGSKLAEIYAEIREIDAAIAALTERRAVVMRAYREAFDLARSAAREAPEEPPNQ